MSARAAAAWLAALLLCTQANAQPGSGQAAPPPRLALPLDCRVGESCWVANYLDTDPSPAAADFRCGPRSYDKHEGVDFAIRDLGVMARGVTVFAAAAGTVRNVRDGMADEAAGDAAARARIEGRDCGNGVLIEHVAGWQTQYCHMRRGSVRVVAGQPVEAGTPLGLVGLSGRTVFPHLHLTVRNNGTLIDPFTGRSAAAAGCGSEAHGLWASDIAYEPVALYNAGFAPGPPDTEAIRRGERSDGPLPVDAPALVLWVDMFGVRAGDSLQLRITGPDGAQLIDTEQAIDRTQAQRFVFVGKKRTVPAWPAGRYTGEVRHRRANGARVVDTPLSVTIDIR